MMEVEEQDEENPDRDHVDRYRVPIKPYRVQPPLLRHTALIARVVTEDSHILIWEGIMSLTYNYGRTRSIFAFLVPTNASAIAFRPRDLCREVREPPRSLAFDAHCIRSPLFISAVNLFLCPPNAHITYGSPFAYSRTALVTHTRNLFVRIKLTLCLSLPFVSA